MANSSIILFGKPNSFEAFEINDAGTAKISDSFIEPELKVSKNDGRIIRYFIRDGYSYLQLYSFALAKGSGREGIVIGAGIRSTSLVALSKGNIYLLNDILDMFQKQALQGSEFIYSGLENVIGKITDGLPVLTTEIKYRGESIGKVHDQTLLLYLPEIARISELKEEINQLKEIYISEGKEVFTAFINKQFLYHLQNKFYIIDEDNRIIEYVDVIGTPANAEDQLFGPLQNNHHAKLAKLERGKARNRKHPEDHPVARRKRFLFLKAIKMALLLLAAVVFFFIGYIFRDSKDKERNSDDTEINPATYRPPEEPFSGKLSEVPLGELLTDRVKLDTLTALCNNVKNYFSNPTVRQHKLMVRRAIYLHLDTAFFTALPKMQPAVPKTATTLAAATPKTPIKKKGKKAAAAKGNADLPDSAKSEKKIPKSDEPVKEAKP